MRARQTQWAVTTLGEYRPDPPTVFTRYRWYARLTKTGLAWVWWMSGKEGEEFVVIPWDMP